MQTIFNDVVHNVAIYCRLSSDDGSGMLESQSIQNQKDYITRYVEDRGWKIYDYYVDDGYSGTNFKRPDFTRMILDIEKGFVDAVITKV